MNLSRVAVPTLFLLSAWNGAPPPAPNTGAPDIRQLEADAIAYRHQHTTTAVVRLFKMRKQSVGQSTAIRYFIAFDPRRLRFDWQGRRLESETWGGKVQYVVTPQGFIDNSLPPANVTIGAANVYDDPYRQFGIWRPVALGMAMTTTEMARRGMYAYLDRNDRNQVTRSQDVLDGLTTWRIDYQLELGLGRSAVSVWFAPEYSNSVVRIVKTSEVDYGGQTSVTTQTLSSTYAQYPTENIWFPRTVDYTSTTDGEVLIEERIIVEEASFGIPIADEMFTLAGLNIEEGRYVSDLSSPNSFAFTGGQVKRVQDPDEAPIPLPTEALKGRGNVAWLLWINVIILAFAGIAFFVSYLRTRRREVQ